MDDYGYAEEHGGAGRVIPARPLTPRRGGRRWLLIGALALAFALTLGAGAVIGSAFLANAQAASFNSGGPAFGKSLVFTASTPGAQGNPHAQGQCDALTVASVNGSTIVAKVASGSSVTIHTTSSTAYTRNGQAATASAVTVGAHIHVQGTHNSDGSITATAIDVG